jgi:hypothetical protein
MSFAPRLVAQSGAPRAVRGPAVDVTEEMRGELFKVLVAIKGDRGLTAALSELEVTLLR